MPKFRFSFERRYSVTEGFDRVIDAPSFNEAMAAAINLSRRFDEDCPDDCSEIESGDTEIGDFEPRTLAREVSAKPDFTIMPDGQVVDTVPAPEEDWDHAPVSARFPGRG